MREDFEIYPIRGYDGKIRYAFNVEYYGHYVCDSMEAAIKKVERVKMQVKRRLEEIERQNQAYYRSLERQQAKMRAELKQAKNICNTKRIKTTTELNKRKQIVRNLIHKGYNNEQIMLRHPDIPLNSIVHIRSAIEKSMSTK